MVSEMKGARDKNDEMKHHTIKSFSQTFTFWYKNVKARKPDVSTAHSHHSPLTLQSKANCHGGVSAKITIGNKAIMGIIRFIRPL